MSKTLQEVLEENNVQTFDSSNGRRVAHCPFGTHRDSRPSFTLYPNETYWCFGCKVWGNPVKFLVDFKGMDAKAAYEYVGVDFTLPKAEKRVIKLKNTLKTGVFLFDVALRYHHNLIITPGPLKYLNDRGLNDQTIANHMIGYTDGSVLTFDNVEDYELSNEVGLLNKDGYEVLSHRIVVPNVIDRTYVDYMIGRTVINDKAKYLGLRMPKPIMGFHQYRHSPILFMVEGQFDWMLLKQWGYPTVVMSGSHITKANVNLLRGKHIVYIPDNDQVGIRAAHEIIERLGKEQVSIIDISSYGYKDVSDWAQYDIAAEDKFEELVQEALCDTLSLNPIYQKYVPQLTIQTQSV